MVTLTADEALPGLLMQIKERAEIRAVNGQLLGYFEPRQETEDEMYQRVRKLFDREELKHLKAAPQKGYTINEVMQHLHSLESRE